MCKAGMDGHGIESRGVAVIGLAGIYKQEDT